MAKLKVVINKPDPGKETINKYKYRYKHNLVKDYQRLHTIQGIRHALYKDRKILFLGAVLLVIVYFLLSE